MNAVEREPVPTRVLNPNASYEPKQRSYRTLCTEMVLYRNVASAVLGLNSPKFLAMFAFKEMEVCFWSNFAEYDCITFFTFVFHDGSKTKGFFFMQSSSGEFGKKQKLISQLYN